MKPQLESLDQALLLELQARFPVEHRPFAALGQKVGLTEEQCLERVAALKQRLIVRQITAVFHAAGLGYRVASIALEIDRPQAAATAERLSRYPGVSYADCKDGPQSVWLSMAVAADAMERVASTLLDLTRASRVLMLPVVRLYKGSELGEVERLELAEESGVSGTGARALTVRDIELIRLVQQDLPILEMPFAVWAEQANLPEPELFAWMQRMQRLGFLTRIGAMVVERDEAQPFGETVLWRVADEQIDALGESLAGSRYVSHCSRRPSYETWPYPLLTKLHSTSRPDLASRVAEQAGGLAYLRLSKLKEYQLRPVKLFAPDLDAWWQETSSTDKSVKINRA